MQEFINKAFINKELNIERDVQIFSHDSIASAKYKIIYTPRKF